ncbi:MAG: hypothetical protein COZ59_08360 [Bacteroidetes bacterium CG_4_8_14_3_um_filter_31_14]|nr:MAG: hypothetical protein COZ59_08360 [Bacteroidetes bacterium CG_4_8_14_3_um_filter_31_14]
MSKLPLAPLLEVIFEVKWPLKTTEDLTKYQYLHGDFFAKLGNKYPFRELLIPPEVPMDAYLNIPAHRFRTAKNSYPLIQIGPGILTVNTTDEKYIWENYEKLCTEAFITLVSQYKFKADENITLSLKYFDFFLYNFKDNNINKFLSDNFHIQLKQTFLKETNNPTSVNLGFFYDTKIGGFSIRMNKGNNSKGQPGIIIDTTISNNSSIPDITKVSKWLNDAHDYVSETFKAMTKGKMYDSFK